MHTTAVTSRNWLQFLVLQDQYSCNIIHNILVALVLRDADARYGGVADLSGCQRNVSASYEIDDRAVQDSCKSRQKEHLSE